MNAATTKVTGPPSVAVLWLGRLHNSPFNEAIPIKHDNVTMSLSLTGIGGSVWITCHVLDLDAGEAVILEKTVTDMPDIDPTVSPMLERQVPWRAHSDRIGDRIGCIPESRR